MPSNELTEYRVKSKYKQEARWHCDVFSQQERRSIERKYTQLVRQYLTK